MMMMMIIIIIIILTIIVITIIVIIIIDTDWLKTFSVPNLSNHCACRDTFTINHALSCKKGGFVAQRLDTIWDLLTLHISEVCKNVETETLGNEVSTTNPLLQVKTRG